MKLFRKELTYILGSVLFFLSVADVYAQQRNTSVRYHSSRTIPKQTSDEDEDDLIDPSRPTIANSAEFQKPGILQIEYGYDGNFHSDEFRSQQTAPLTLRFAPFERLLLELDVDPVIFEKDETGMSESGVGDTRIGLQVLALKDTERHPALAFAYYAKVPTASQEKNLGTGRTDHRLVALLSKKFGEMDVDFNVAYLNVGREFGGRASGGQAALAISREFKNNFGVIGEIAGQSEDDVQPKGVFALGALTYRFNTRLHIDVGARFGLNSEAPRVGIFAGFTVGIGNPFK